jgi:lysozyme
MTLADRLLQHEGLRLQVYDDANGKPIGPGSHVVGNPTIGVGTLICAPGGITEAEAHLLLSNRVRKAQKAAESLVGLAFIAAEPVRFDVLTEMAFQMGGDGLAKFTNTLQAVREKRWGDAADGMLYSLWARQTPKRAQALAEVMRTGVA